MISFSHHQKSIVSQPRDALLLMNMERMIRKLNPGEDNGL
jgi:hypothetical protein